MLGAVGDSRGTENDFDLIGVASTRGEPRPAVFLAAPEDLADFHHGQTTTEIAWKTG